MAGLPGTGLGGIFYALLVLWMTLREMWFKARGIGEGGRWPTIARLNALLGGIVLALWAEGWLLQNLLGPFSQLSEPTTWSLAVGALAPALAVAPFVVLAALLIAMHAARLIAAPSGGSPAEGPQRDRVMHRKAA